MFRATLFEKLLIAFLDWLDARGQAKADVRGFSPRMDHPIPVQPLDDEPWYNKDRPAHEKAALKESGGNRNQNP